jgi:hypothetical protein
MSRSRWVLTSVLTSVLAPSLAASQVTVVPRRGIDWGRLMPSVNAHVDPQDALHRGEIDFVGTGPREVLVSLPTKLVSRRGDELPVSFRAGEVLLAYNRTNTVTAPDPRQPILVHPTASTGNATLLLGGTAMPSSKQPSGIYEAVITVASRVTLSPTGLYLSSRERSGAFTIYNEEDVAVEIQLSFAFGYPVSDSIGHLDVPLTEHAPAGEPSAAEWLRVYPRRVVLQPKRRQLVRIAAYPPDLQSGEYWARLLVTSHRVPPASASTDAPQHTAVRLNTVYVTAVNYRNGVVSTGVEVDSATVRRTATGASLTLELRRSGNAAYLGRLVVSALARDGSVLAQTSEPLAVYRTLRRIITLALPSGTRADAAQITYSLSTQRDDVPSAMLISAAPRAGRLALDR